ncbi:LysR family transcriptional regulator, partial [Escherichia coli]
AVREALRAGTLIEILPQYRAAPLPVTLHYPHRRNLSRRVHLFMVWLTETIKEAAE